jgi:UDP-N-acetylmuramate--alanine ligase
VTNSTAFALDGPRRLHVVGVGGPGMSGIAIICAGLGHHVTGSDRSETSYLDAVRAAGVVVNSVADPGIVASCDAVVRSSAIGDDHIEVAAARAAGVTVLNRADLLNALTTQLPTIAVAGAHGKTTSASMLTRVLQQQGRAPAYLIGGLLTDTGRGADIGSGNLLVLEADESDATFLGLHNVGALITNIDDDFLHTYENVRSNLDDAFVQFADAVHGPCVVCLDDDVLANRVRLGDRTTYGLHADADVRLLDRRSLGDRQLFTVVDRVRGETVAVELPLRGEHMALNATGVMAIARQFDVSYRDSADALSSFGGVGRRFERRHVVNDVTLVDDYGHLPAEISAVLAAARNGAGHGDASRVVVVFQPNRYTRMSVMSPDYADAFVDADVIIVGDVYASGEAVIEGVTGQLVVDAVRNAHRTVDITYVHDRGAMAAVVGALVQPGDMVISMGCGDIESFPDELAAWLREATELTPQQASS